MKRHDERKMKEDQPLKHGFPSDYDISIFFCKVHDMTIRCHVPYMLCIALPCITALFNTSGCLLAAVRNLADIYEWQKILTLSWSIMTHKLCAVENPFADALSTGQCPVPHQVKLTLSRRRTNALCLKV